MPERQVLHGAVIISYEKRSHGVVELLAARLRNRITLTHYLHPHELDVRAPLRFIIVFSVEDLAGVVRVFDTHHAPTPLIIHIDTPEVITQCHYAELFPGVEIAPVTQSGLQDKTSTLKIIMFEDIIHHLEQLTLASGTPSQAARQQVQGKHHHA